ncbi:hypothetical protein [Nocardia yunnanensis]|nr:hypothetical protein [Nocardia yunnanensis]
MRKILAVSAMALGISGVGMAVAHAESYFGGNYATVDACVADGSKGSWTTPDGRQIDGGDGWQYSCDPQADGTFNLTLFR